MICISGHEYHEYAVKILVTGNAALEGIACCVSTLADEMGTVDYVLEHRDDAPRQPNAGAGLDIVYGLDISHLVHEEETTDSTDEDEDEDAGQANVEDAVPASTEDGMADDGEPATANAAADGLPNTEATPATTSTPGTDITNTTSDATAVTATKTATDTTTDTETDRPTDNITNATEPHADANASSASQVETKATPSATAATNKDTDATQPAKTPQPPVITTTAANTPGTDSTRREASAVTSNPANEASTDQLTLTEKTDKQTPTEASSDASNKMDTAPEETEEAPTKPTATTTATLATTVMSASACCQHPGGKAPTPATLASCCSSQHDAHSASESSARTGDADKPQPNMLRYFSSTKDQPKAASEKNKTSAGSDDADTAGQYITHDSIARCRFFKMALATAPTIVI